MHKNELTKEEQVWLAIYTAAVSNSSGTVNMYAENFASEGLNRFRKKFSNLFK